MLNILSIDSTVPPDLNQKVDRAQWGKLKQARFTCACCGYQSAPSESVLSGFMQVVNKEVLCAICASALQLQRPVRNLSNHGFVIMASDLTQSEVTRLSREIGFAILSGDSTRRERAETVFEQLLESEITYSDFQFLTKDEPQTCAEMAVGLSVIGSLDRNEYAKYFKDLRYVPSFAAFSHIYEYWLKTSS